MTLLSANGAILIDSLWATLQGYRKLERLALRVRFNRSLKRAFSAQSQFDFCPGALPQAAHDVALLALNQ